MIDAYGQLPGELSGLAFLEMTLVKALPNINGTQLSRSLAKTGLNFSDGEVASRSTESPRRG